MENVLHRLNWMRMHANILHVLHIIQVCMYSQYVIFGMNPSMYQNVKVQDCPQSYTYKIYRPMLIDYTVSALLQPHSWIEPHCFEKLLQPQSKTFFH